MGNEFMYGLVGGIIILVLMVLIFNAQAVPAPYQGYRYTDSYRGYAYAEPVYNLSANLTDAAFVGIGKQRAVKFLELGKFDVSTAKSTAHAEKRIFNGLLFGDQSVRFEGYIESVAINVTDTNNYGSLVVVVREKDSIGNVLKSYIVFDKKAAIGTYVILVNRLSEVEVRTSGSGWRFWAPALYSLSIDADMYSAASREFSFAAHANATDAEIRLLFSKRFGKAAVDVNGVNYINGSVSDYETIALPKEKLWQTNKILVKSLENSAIAGYIQVRVTEETEKSSSARLSFGVNSTQYEALGTKYGKITFDVVKVEKPGGLAVKIVDMENNAMFSAYEQASQWQYTEYFARGNVKPGKNTVVIEAADSSAFWVKGVQVWLPAKQ
jgi:hypothetical protein